MSAQTTLYTLSNAFIHPSGDEELVVAPASPAWHGAAVFAILGLAIIFLSPAQALLAGVLFTIAIVIVVGSPLSARFSVDFQAGEITYTANYLIHRPRQVQARFPLAQVIHIAPRPSRLGQGCAVEVVMADGTLFVLQFGRRADSAADFIEELSEASPAAAPASTPEASLAAARRVTQAVAANDVRAWSLPLILLGAAQLLAGPNSWPWGLLLIAVGVVSYFLREPSMLMIYAVVLGWAALTNVLFGAWIWKFFAVLQVYFTAQVVQQFLQARPTAAPGSEPDWGRSGRVFPWLAAALGGLSLLGLALFFGIIVVNAFTFRSNGLLPILTGLESLAVDGGLLGVALGLAGWLGRYPHRHTAGLGFILGALTLVAHLGLILLPRL